MMYLNTNGPSISTTFIARIERSLVFQYIIGI